MADFPAEEDSDYRRQTVFSPARHDTLQVPKPQNLYGVTSPRRSTFQPTVRQSSNNSRRLFSGSRQQNPPSHNQNMLNNFLNVEPESPAVNNYQVFSPRSSSRFIDSGLFSPRDRGQRRNADID